MTKAAAVKGMAVQALQPAADGPPVAKAVLPKAPRGPPAKARGARPGAAAAKAAPRSKQTAAELQNAIADASGLPPKDAKRFLEALCDVVAKNLRETNVFKLHGVVLIRMRKTPPRRAVTRSIFGKEVVLPASSEDHGRCSEALVRCRERWRLSPDPHRLAALCPSASSLKQNAVKIARCMHVERHRTFAIVRTRGYGLCPFLSLSQQFGNNPRPPMHVSFLARLQSFPSAL